MLIVRDNKISGVCKVRDIKKYGLIGASILDDVYVEVHAHSPHIVAGGSSNSNCLSTGNEKVKGDA